MAMNHSDLLELFDPLHRLRSGIGSGRPQALYQELIEAEATAVIGAGPWRAHRSRAPTQRNGSAVQDDHDHVPGIWSCGSRSCGRVVLPQPAGKAPPGRPGPVRGGDGGLPARGEHPQGRRPGQSARRGYRGSPRVRCRGSAPIWTRRSRRSGTGPCRRGVPLRVPGRHLLQGPGQPPGRVPSGGDRHRGGRRRAPRGAVDSSASPPQGHVLVVITDGWLCCDFIAAWAASIPVSMTPV